MQFSHGSSSKQGRIKAIRGRSMIFRIATMCVAAFVLFTAGIRPSLSATDLNTVIQFNIPPGPLPGALLKYSSQSGIQVTSASDLVDRKQSAGVKGSLPA